MTPVRVYGMVQRLVRGVRDKLNGHAKAVVGGIGVGTIVTGIVWTLINERYAVMSSAADRVPVLETRLIDHEKMSSAVDRVPVLETRLSDHENLPVHPGAGAMIANLAQQVERLNVAQDKRFEDKQQADDRLWTIQSATNGRLEEGQKSIEVKLDRVIEKLDKKP